MATTRIKKYQLENLDIVNADINASANIATSKLADGASFLNRNGSVAWTGNQNAGTNTLTNLGTPVNPNDAVRLVDLQNVQLGIDFKPSVRSASNAGENVTISNPGTSNIGSLSLVAGDRVLLKNQSTTNQNGIYIFNGSGSAMTRATDADTSAKVTTGMYTYVEEGGQAGQAWVLTTANPITLGTTGLAFAQFSGGGGGGFTSASGGIVVNGNDIAVGTASSSRIVINGANIDLATTAVTPGTYSKVTVDAYGRVTLGASATAADVGAQASHAFLAALVGLGTNGMLSKNGNAVNSRTITGTVNNITISNGDGVSGNPTIDLANTAVTPGTYQGLVVDQKGRITGATDTGYLVGAKIIGDEVPSGTIDGSNKTFTLINPVKSGSLILTVNGVKMKVGASADYTYTGNTISFVTGAEPRTGDLLVANYIIQ